MALLRPTTRSVHIDRTVFPLTTTLPLDVVFHIIDIGLYNNSPTLRNMSLTCHVIYSYTRRYKFRSVRLRVGDLLASNVPKFLVIIRASPSILSCICNMHLILGLEVSIPDEKRIAEVDALCSIMQEELPNLTNLHLRVSERELNHVGGAPRFRNGLIQLFGNPKLSKLTVWGFGSFDMKLLGHAKSVVDFAIQSVWPIPGDDDTVTDIALNSNSATQSPPRLRPVIFTLYDPPWRSVVLDSGYCDLSAVSTFRFYGFEFNLIPLYLAKFNSLALTRLEIYLTNYRNYDDGGPPILDLSALHNVQHLTITHHAKFRSGQYTSDSVIEFQWIINILCSLPSPNLVESIRILTRSNDLSCLHTVDWPLLDSSVFGSELIGTALTRKWPSLKNLDFVFMQDRYDLSLFGTEFQEVWLHRTLMNFRDKTAAVLSVRFEAWRSILDYAPEGMRG